MWLGGITISRATLHNRDEIERLDVRVGDVVVLERGGEVIPKIVGVSAEKRTGRERKFRFPKDCPSCGSTLVESEDEVAVRCENPSCPQQLERRIEHFASRNAMDIAGLGSQNVKLLLDKGLVRSFADLYRLRVDDLLHLEPAVHQDVVVLARIALELGRAAEQDAVGHGAAVEQVGGGDETVAPLLPLPHTTSGSVLERSPRCFSMAATTPGPPCRRPTRPRSPAPGLASLTAFDGQYPADAGIWKSEPLRTRMVRLLGGDFELFLENVKTSGPISVENGLLYVMGNWSSSAKVWGAGLVVVDPTGDRILIKHYSDAWDSIRTYSDGDIAVLPKDVMTMLGNWADRPQARAAKPAKKGAEPKG